MCKFFSFVSDPDKHKHHIMYFNWEQRQRIMAGEINVENADSHTEIADFYGYRRSKMDTLNKYEYNPITKIFTVDQINNPCDDRDLCEKWVRELDFKTVVWPLNIKKIKNPLTGIPKKPAEQDMENLKKWASVGASARDSVWPSDWVSAGPYVRVSVGDSVRDSVRVSVGDSVRDSVRAAVWDSVGSYVGSSIWDSVGSYIWDPVWDSVWDYVGAYYSSFFKIEYKRDLTPAIALWSRGFVPSFDGKTWRLHSGKNAEIVCEWNP